MSNAPLANLRDLIRNASSSPQPLEHYVRRARSLRRRRYAVRAVVVLMVAGAGIGVPPSIAKQPAKHLVAAQHKHGLGPSSTEPHRHRLVGAVSASLVSATPELEGSPLPAKALQTVAGATWLFTSDTIYRDAADSGWTTTGSPGTGITIVGAQALNASNAWVLSFSGQPGSVTVDVARTSDGGASWQTTTVSSGSSVANGWIDFANAKDGFLTITASSAGPFATTQLYGTTDGGASWMPVQGSVATTVGPLYFANSSLGWGLPASGGPGLSETTDGGQTWTPVSLPSPGSLPDGLSAGQASPGLPVPAGSGTLVLPVSFSDGLSVSLVFYVSTDSGSTWTPTRPLNDSNLPAAGYALPVSVASPNVWTVSTPEAVYITNDGGQSWQTVSTALSGAAIMEVAFASSEVGYLLTTLESCNQNETSCTPATVDHLLATSDGGSTWSSVSPGQSASSGA